MKFEMMVECDGLFGSFCDEEDLDLDVKFSPACFCHFERRFF